MARHTQTVHSCDACDTVVGKSADLRRFQVRVAKRPRPRYGDQDVIVHTDLCVTCEPRFLGALDKFLGEDASPNDLRREAK